MSLRIRLRRVGRKKQPSYRIVVANSAAPRDGTYIDDVGFYNPRMQPAELRLDVQKVETWVAKGATLTDTAASLLRKARKGGDAKVALKTAAPEPAPAAEVVEKPQRAPRKPKPGSTGEPVAEAAPASEEPAAPAAEAPATPEAGAAEYAMTDAPAEPERLVVGHIAKAHGTRGEVFVWPLTDRPEAVFAPGGELVLGDQDGDAEAGAPTVTVAQAREFKRGLLVKLQGVDPRTEAEGLARKYLLAPLAVLGPLEEGEVFYHQLLGASVETLDGAAVGTVREVYETEPAHLLEVESPEGKRHLVPFAERVVREVDAAGKRIVIDPPAGLLEL